MPRKKIEKTKPEDIDLRALVLAYVKRAPWSTAQNVKGALTEQKIEVNYDKLKSVLADLVKTDALIKIHEQQTGYRYAFPDIDAARVAGKAARIDMEKLPWIHFPSSVKQCDELLDVYDTITTHPRSTFAIQFEKDIILYVEALRKRYVIEEKGS